MLKLTLAIAVCTLIGCHSVVDKQAIATTTEQTSFLWQDLERARRETELLDDGTEKILNRNKSLFLGLSLLFVWMIYQSLFNSNNK